MATWICVILQGALRKWIFPGANILYFVQDVPLLFAYVYAFWKGLVWGGKVAWTCIVVSILISIQAMLQLIFGDLHLRTAVIGLHNYIFYLPVLFIAPVSFNFMHRKRFIRWNLLFAIPMSLIAALQSRSPKGAWINRTSAGDDTAFSLTSDTVRATGTFNFTLMYSVWCGIVVALMLGEWLLPPERRTFKSRIVLLLCTLCAVMANVVSGSRTAVLLSAFAFIGGFAAVVFTRNVKHIVRFTAVLVLMPVIFIIGYFAAPKSVNAVIDRFSGESNEQSIETRINHQILGFTYAAKFSVLGLGVGYGIPAANPAAAAAGGLILSENEPIRMLQEMGTFTGTALVLMRYFAGFGLLLVGFQCLQLPRGHTLPHGLPLAFTVAPTLMVGELLRSAPVLASQVYFCAALILGAVLFQHEPLVRAVAQPFETR